MLTASTSTHYVDVVNTAFASVIDGGVMAIHEELSRFLKEGLGKGLSRQELEQVLLETGWPSDQVTSALGAFADVDFSIPVPRPKPYLSAREAFVYLVLFSTLYVSAFSLGNLCFELISRAFPDPSIDPAFAVERSRAAIRWAISLLVVTFPVFAVVTRQNERSLRADPARRLSEVRRWLTYLTLFVAAGFLIGDVTGVVYNLLGGELTTRFLLKVGVVAMIAGSVFAYLVKDLRGDEVAK
jgi:hypothetical protein